MIKIKRIYEKLEEDDGYRILIDHLWPRGISKEKAKIDLWYKEISPSNELRQWFNHDPEKWLEFQKKYKEELKLKKEIVNELKEIIKKNLPDHEFLNKVLPFNPTAENLSKYFFITFQEIFSNKPFKIKSVTLWESNTCGCSYSIS